MKMISAFMAFCEKNPPVTSGFPSQRVSDMGALVFYGDKAVEQKDN